MPVENTLRFQLYSVQELPQELRTFQLPAYPYTAEGLLNARVEDFFDTHGVIQFRDERHVMSLLITPKDSDPTPIYDRTGFQAFMSIGILDLDTMSMWQWRPGTDAAKYRKIVKRYGDDYAWMAWNKPVIVLSIDERRIAVQ